MPYFSSRFQSQSWLINMAQIVVSTLILFSLAACGETKDAETYISEAVEYQKKGEDKAAIIQLKNALQQEPNNKNARFLLGTLYYKNDDLLSAEKELNRALDLGMNPNQILPELSHVLFDLGKFQHLLDTIKQHPEVNSSEINTLRGRALLAIGKNEESKTILKQVLAENPGAPEALIGLAQHALSENDLETATELSERAVEKNPENPTAWRFKANLLRAQGDAEAALEAFERVTELAPNDISVYNDKAAIEIALGRFDDAKNSIDHARELAPDSLMVHYSQALLDFTQNKHEEALDSIQTVLSAAPEHLPSVLLAGAIQLSLNSLRQAEQHLEQYLKKIPGNLYARKLMINTLIRSNQTKQAIEVLEPTLEAAQQDPQLLAMAGEAYMRTGEFTKATNFFEKANKIAPNNAFLHTALGLSKLATGDREHAIAELQLAKDLSKNSHRAGILLALTHLRSNEFDKALSVIDELEKEDPQNPLFHNLKGAAYMSQDDFAAARTHFNKALAIQPGFFPAISNLARLDLQDQKPDKAKKRFEAVLNNDEKNIQAMNALAALALSQGNTHEATKWLKRASDRNPNALDPALRLGAHYLRIEEKEKALLLARKLFGAQPDEPRVLELLGKTQLAHDNHAAALDSYEKLAAELPESAAAQLQIAKLHSAMKDLPATSSALKKALRINPDYIEAKVALARLAVIEDKEAEAMAMAQKIQKEHTDIPVGHELEADLLMKQKKPEMASKAYKKALSMRQSGPLIIKSHIALTQAGNEKQANSLLTEWLADNPNDVTTHLYLANNYITKERYADAIEEYEQILQKNPEHILSLNNLAWLYQQNKDPRALEIAERAYEIAPESPAVLDTLGWIFAEKAVFDKALPLLEEAASKLPDNASIQYHYAYVLTNTENQHRARQILDKIITSGNEFPEIKEARALLQQVQ